MQTETKIETETTIEPQKLNKPARDEQETKREEIVTYATETVETTPG